MALHELLGALVLCVYCTNGNNVFLQDSPEYRLKQDLFAGYDKSVRPTIKPNEPLTVALTLSLGRIGNLDEKNEELTTFLWLSAVWEDYFLKWNPNDYNQTYKLVVGKDDPWFPEIALFNGVEQGNDLAYEAKFRVWLNPNGAVIWAPGFKLQTTCTVKLRLFPFDTQTCDIIFTNWMYNSASVNFTMSDEPFMVNNYQPNGVWHLKNYSGVVQLVDYTGGGFAYFPQAKFSMILERKPLFHGINVLLPCVIISFIAGLVFSVPPASGEKISLGISVVLSFSVLLLLLSDIMPRTSEEMPLLTMFITVTMTLNTLSLLMAVVILRLFHHSPGTRVPTFLRLLILRFLATVVCMRKPNAVVPEKQPLSKKTEPKEKLKVENLEKEGKPIPAPSPIVLPEKVNELVDRMLEKQKEAEEAEQNRDEWERVAMVVDRFCLIFYYILFFASLIVIMALIFGRVEI